MPEAGSRPDNVRPFEIQVPSEIPHLPTPADSRFFVNLQKPSPQATADDWSRYIDDMGSEIGSRSCDPEQLGPVKSAILLKALDCSRCGDDAATNNNIVRILRLADGINTKILDYRDAIMPKAEVSARAPRAQERGTERFTVRYGDDGAGLRLERGQHFFVPEVPASSGYVAAQALFLEGKKIPSNLVLEFVKEEARVACPHLGYQAQEIIAKGEGYSQHDLEALKLHLLEGAFNCARAEKYGNGGKLQCLSLLTEGSRDEADFFAPRPWATIEKVREWIELAASLDDLAVTAPG